ncbi:MAG: hypothetical protein HND58_15230 [Planctomycetota bacterium]|nr:MAG: hypothetical protein HND58_15230 [Planctomycetota bacterium]
MCAAEIDVSSAQGQADYARLLQRLIDREQNGIDQHVEAVSAAAALASSAAESLQQQFAPAMPALANAITAAGPNADAARSGLDQWAALLRVSSRQLADAAAAATRAVTEPDPRLPIPPLDDAETRLRATLLQRAAELEALAGDLREVAPLDGRGRGDDAGRPRERPPGRSGPGGRGPDSSAAPGCAARGPGVGCL